MAEGGICLNGTLNAYGLGGERARLLFDRYNLEDRNALVSIMKGDLWDS